MGIQSALYGVSHEFMNPSSVERAEGSPGGDDSSRVIKFCDTNLWSLHPVNILRLAVQHHRLHSSLCAMLLPIAPLRESFLRR